MSSSIACQKTPNNTDKSGSVVYRGTGYTVTTVLFLRLYFRLQAITARYNEQRLCNVNNAIG